MPKGPLELLRLCSARGACMPRGSALQFSPQKQVPTPVHAARITLSQSDGRAVPARPSTTDAQQRALPSSTTKRVHFGARRFALPFTRMCRVFILIRILPQARTTSYKFWGVFQRVSS